MNYNKDAKSLTFRRGSEVSQVYIYIYTYVYRCVGVCACLYLSACIYTYIYTYIHICIFAISIYKNMHMGTGLGDKHMPQIYVLIGAALKQKVL